MKCAIVDADGVILNIVVCDPSEPAPDGCRFEPIDSGVYCNPGELWADRLQIPPDPVEPI